MAETGNKPQDPSALTTAQLQRELEHFREFFEISLRAEIGKVESRLDGTDAALELANKFPTEIDKAVTSLNTFNAQKFSHIDELYQINTEAREKAFAAAKELVEEQRRSSEEAIRKTEVSISLQLKNHAEIANDMKDRMLRLDNSMLERDSASRGAASQWGYIVVGLGVLNTIVVLFIAVAAFLR